MRCCPARVELVEPVGEAAEEPFEGVGELEVGFGVVQLGVEAVELRLQGGLALAQGGHSGAQLVERDAAVLGMPRSAARPRRRRG